MITLTLLNGKSLALRIDDIISITGEKSEMKFIAKLCAIQVDTLLKTHFLLL